MEAQIMTKKPLILIVDDNIINRQYFSMALKKSNCKVIAVENGQLAIDQAKKRKFDVILMDIRMPEMDGYECTRAIRTLAIQDETPIYATSAEELFEDQADLFTGFLLKPISPKQLNQTISRHIMLEVPLVYDKTKALQFAYNDSAIVETLTDLFIKEFPLQISKLRDYIDLTQINKCQDLVHKMKGSCKACGAQQIEDLLKEFSNLCNNKKKTQMLNLLEKLKLALKSYKLSTQRL